MNEFHRMIQMRVAGHVRGKVGSGNSLPIFHPMHSDPIPRLETVQSHFQQKAKVNDILIYEL